MLQLSFPIEQVQLFIFVLVRVAAILFSIPFLDARAIPMMIKAGLAVAATVMVLPNLNLTAPPLIGTPLAFALGMVGEVAIGLIIGLAAQLVFTGIQLAGQMGGFQMGFAIANVVDPASSLQIPVLAQFLNLFALMVFLGLDIHHHFIRAMADGFVRIPLWGAHFEGDLFRLVMQLVANAFVIAVKVGAPVMVAMLLTSVALGLMARTVPQMQIFIVAMPLKILLGMGFLLLSLPYLSTFMQGAFAALGRTVQGMMGLF